MNGRIKVFVRSATAVLCAWFSPAPAQTPAPDGAPPPLSSRVALCLNSSTNAVGISDTAAMIRMFRERGFEVWGDPTGAASSRTSIWIALLRARAALSEDGMLIVYWNGPVRVGGVTESESVWIRPASANFFADPKDDLGLLTSVLPMVAPAAGQAILLISSAAPAPARSWFSAAEKRWVEPRSGAERLLLWAGEPGNRLESSGTASRFREAVAESQIRWETLSGEETGGKLENIARQIRLLTDHRQVAKIWRGPRGNAARIGADEREALGVLAGMLSARDSNQRISGWLIRLARMAEISGRTDAALAYAAEAERWSPAAEDRATAALIRGRWLRAAGRQAEARDAFSEADNTLEKAGAGADELKAETSVELGELLENDGETTEARTAFGRGLDFWDRSGVRNAVVGVRLHTGLGRMVRAEGNALLGQREQEQALKIGERLPPDARGLLAETWLSMGRGFLESGSLTNAMDALARGIDIFEGGARLRFPPGELFSTRGLVHRRAERWSESLENYRRAFELTPKPSGASPPSDAEMGMLRALVTMQQWREAGRMISAFDARKAPPQPEWVRMAGVIAEASGDLNSAQRSFERAIEINSISGAVDGRELVESLYRLADIYARTQRAAAAFQLCERAMERPELKELPELEPQIIRLAAAAAQDGGFTDKAVVYARKTLEGLKGEDPAALRDQVRWRSFLAERLLDDGKQGEACDAFSAAMDYLVAANEADLRQWATLYEGRAKSLSLHPAQAVADACSALCLWERAEGMDHPSVARTCRLLATLHRERGAPILSCRYLDRAEIIYRLSGPKFTSDRNAVAMQRSEMDRVLAMPPPVGDPEDLSRISAIERSLRTAGANTVAEPSGP